MPRGVRVFGAKRRAKGVDITKGHGHELAFELSRDGQMRLFAKEVLLKIDLPMLIERRMLQIQSRDRKKLSGSLAIIGGNDRCVRPDKAFALKKLMDCRGQGVTNTKHRTKGVGARPQMRNLAQKFQGVALLL